MARARRNLIPASTRGLARDRHGRGIRAAVTGPYLPRLRGRADLFEMTVASTAEYLTDLYPEELGRVRFEIAGMPSRPSSSARGVDRWTVVPSESRIILYRVPVERLAKLHRDDDFHRRLMIESIVFRAVAELLGRDPWDIAPDRFRHF